MDGLPAQTCCSLYMAPSKSREYEDPGKLELSSDDSGRKGAFDLGVSAMVGSSSSSECGAPAPLA